MIVGGGNRDYLSDSLVGKLIFGHPLELSWIIKSSNSNNATLATGKPRNRMNSSDSAWVSQRNSGVFKVICGELVLPGFGHKFFVSADKLSKVHLLSALYVWNKKCSRAVRFWDVDS